MICLRIGACSRTGNCSSELAIRAPCWNWKTITSFRASARTASGQVTSIATGPGGKLFLAAANPGKLFTMGPDNEPEGTFESQPF